MIKIKKLISLFLTALLLFSTAAIAANANENGKTVLVTISTDKSSYAFGDTAAVTVKVENKSGLTLNDVAISAEADNWLLAKGSNSNLLEVGDMGKNETKTLSFNCVLNYTSAGIGFFSRIILFFRQLFNRPFSFKTVSYTDKSSTYVSASVNHGGATVNITATAWYAPDGEQDGSLIEFGSYPQSQVTDSSLLSALNAQSGTWASYYYYQGNGSLGSMAFSDYMRYKDVTYNGNKYRAVTFDSYRPSWTGNTPGAENSNQDENGYTTGNIYWFRFDPVKWKILDKNTGLVMCASIIDSQPYNNIITKYGTDAHGNDAYWGNSGRTYYACNYAKSSIRQWLNGDFYNTAFTSSEKSKIKTTTLNTKGYCTLTGTAGYEDFDITTVSDKVFLLSYDEVLNSGYGFSPDYFNFDAARRVKGSDYAKCQGLNVIIPGDSSYAGYSYWRLRSPGRFSDASCFVSPDGRVNSRGGTDNADIGIRPALTLNLSSLES